MQFKSYHKRMVDPSLRPGHPAYIDRFSSAESGSPVSTYNDSGGVGRSDPEYRLDAPYGSLDLTRLMDDRIRSIVRENTNLKSQMDLSARDEYAGESTRRSDSVTGASRLSSPGASKAQLAHEPDLVLDRLSSLASAGAVSAMSNGLNMVEDVLIACCDYIEHRVGKTLSLNASSDQSEGLESLSRSRDDTQEHGSLNALTLLRTYAAECTALLYHGCYLAFGSEGEKGEGFEALAAVNDYAKFSIAFAVAAASCFLRQKMFDCSPSCGDTSDNHLCVDGLKDILRESWKGSTLYMNLADVCRSCSEEESLSERLRARLFLRVAYALCGSGDVETYDYLDTDEDFETSGGDAAYDDVRDSVTVFQGIGFSMPKFLQNLLRMVFKTDSTSFVLKDTLSLLCIRDVSLMTYLMWSMGMASSGDRWLDALCEMVPAVRNADSQSEVASCFSSSSFPTGLLPSDDLSELVSALLETPLSYEMEGQGCLSQKMVRLASSAISRVASLVDDVARVRACGASCKEWSTAIHLPSSVIMHTPLSGKPHPVHSSIPAGFQSRLDAFRAASSSMADWINSKRAERISLGTLPFSLDARALHLPRLTSQGIFLKTQRDGDWWRVTSKVLLAKLGRMCKDSVALNRALQELGACFTRRGYSDPSHTFIQGIRRQHTRKEEPVDHPPVRLWSDARMPYGSAAVPRSTLRCQGRVRGIFMPSELFKAHHKAYCDDLKDIIFSAEGCFSVDQAYLARKQRLVSTRLMTAGLMGSHGENPCFVDLSAFDTTTHLGFYHSYYDVVENVDAYKVLGNAREYMLSSAIASPLDMSETSPICEFASAGWSTLSGEPAVTVKNNVVHMLACAVAVSEVFDENVADSVRNILEDRSERYCFHFHGDDSFRWLGDDPTVYDRVDSILEEMGLKVGRELGPFFLKRQVSPACYGVCSGVDDVMFLGIGGSLMKNRFGEYPRSLCSVIVAGLVDVYGKMSTTFARDVQPFMHRVLDWCALLDPRLSGVRLELGMNQRQLLRSLEQDSKLSQSRAREVQSMIDRIYYSNDVFSATEEFGSLLDRSSYEVSSAANELSQSFPGMPDDYDGLLELVLRLQNYILDSEGTAPDESILQDIINTINGRLP